MKKSLIALAVAGAFAAPAFAATGNVDIYGIMSFALEDTDSNGVDIAVVDRVSRIGFKGSEDLGGGLKAVWQVETQLNATKGYSMSKNGLVGVDGPGSSGTVVPVSGGASFGNSFALRNTFVGLAGDFGTVLMGRHDTPYKMGTGSLDPFADTIADYNSLPDGVALIDAAHDHRSPQALAYVSPTWSGFHFAVAGVATNDIYNLNNGDSFDAVSATAVYANGPLFASLSYQNVELIDSDAWKVGLGYTFGDTKVGFIYEDVENYFMAGGRDRDSWMLNVVHNMGPIALKAEYGQADLDAGQDASAWALGVDYSLSKRTVAYAVITNGDNDSGDDVTGWALGMKHSF